MLKILHKIKPGLNSQKGFTLLEVMITTTIMAILFGVITFNLIRTQNASSGQSNLDKLVSDIKAQQTKAMTGSTEGRATTDNYGIYFMVDKYILFHGSSYVLSETSNYTVDLPSDVQIESTTLPNNTLVFSVLSGEIIGFSQSANSIVFKMVNANEQVMLTLNRYGVITGIN